MNQYEEDLQKKIEAGIKPDAEEIDIQAYREVFSRLKSEPDFHLSTNFADSIVTRIAERKKHDASRDFFWFGAGTFLLFAALVTAVIMSGFKPNLGFLKNMSSYLGLFIFGVSFILILNFLEKRIIPHRNPFSETDKVE
ncbi:MAG: hypothetical protein C0490_17685 [Marivirga sp.]|nr:hypothetical protein [Marivirga sp.]